MSVCNLAHAQTAAEFEQLRARVEQLEAASQDSRNSGLTFGLGSATKLTVYGFIRAEAFYDFDFDQGDSSDIGAFGTANATGGAFNTSTRVSRLGFRVESDTDIGKIGGQLEYDLFGSNGTAELRLRHANITVGGFLLGQFWTNFMPRDQQPTTADFTGSVGTAFARVPQLRYSGATGNLDYSFSIEEAAWASDDPVVTAAAEYGTDLFTVRLAGLSGKVIENGFENDAYGVTVSGAIKPWQGGLLSGTYVTGEGIGGILIGRGDGVTTAGTANDVEGFTLEVRQDLAETINVGIAYGQEDYDNPGDQDLSRLETVHVNAFWQPTDKLNFGVEYIFGKRTDGAGERLDGDRIGLSATFSF
jgi:DcaP outer membrane protein